MALPSFPTKTCRCTTWSSVHWSSLVMDTAHLGPSGLPGEHACQIYFPELALLAYMERRDVVWYTAA